MLRKKVGFLFIFFTIHIGLSFVFAQNFFDDKTLWIKYKQKYIATWLVTKCDISEMKYIRGLTRTFEDYSQEVQMNYNYVEVDSFCKLWESHLMDYFSLRFKGATCRGESGMKEDSMRWQYHQEIDPEHLYYFRFDLPDSATLLHLVKEKAIRVNKICPCELTKEGVIPLKPKADCSKYGFRLVAYYEKKTNVKILKE